MKISYIVAGLVLALGIGYGVGRYQNTGKQIEEKKVVIKETETVVREIKGKDGTVIKEVITRDTSKKESDNKVKIDKNKNKIGIFGKYDLEDKTSKYGLHYERRIGDSPFYGGVLVDTEKNVGLSISMEF